MFIVRRYTILMQKFGTYLMQDYCQHFFHSKRNFTVVVIDRIIYRTSNLCNVSNRRKFINFVKNLYCLPFFWIRSELFDNLQLHCTIQESCNWKKIKQCFSKGAMWKIQMLFIRVLKILISHWFQFLLYTIKCLLSGF